MPDMDAPVFGATTSNGDMPYSDSTMQDGADNGDVFADTQFVADDAPLTGDGPLEDDASLYDEFLSADSPEPDASLIEPTKRGTKAKTYERKVRGLFATSVKITCAHESTIADSAALLMHGPNIAEKAGDLAAENARFARAVDMLTDQTENAATALIIASAPLVLQLLRNHEPVAESDRPARTFRIPLTKRRLRFKVGVKLGKRMRNVTNDPALLTTRVFTNPEVREALRKQGIDVVIGG